MSLSKIIGPSGAILDSFLCLPFSPKISVDTPEYRKFVQQAIIQLFASCARCNKQCGCIQCAIGLPCTCKMPICFTCTYIHPKDMPHLCVKCGTYPCPCTNGINNPWFQSVQQANNQLMGPSYASIMNNVSISNNIRTGLAINIKMNCLVCKIEPCNCIVACNCINCSSNLCPNCNITTIRQAQQALPALSTGPQYYNPTMLQRGNDADKIAREKAIETRNAMLGDKAKDLYSPHGLQIPSKKWPGRVYVAYAHHVSLQVYDNGINTGRLDVHVDGYAAPMGDVHLSAILRVMYAEEDMIKDSYFSRVRDI